MKALIFSSWNLAQCCRLDSSSAFTCTDHIQPYGMYVQRPSVATKYLFNR